MHILVNHLTRMQPGYICVAGVDVNTMSHVRPVLPRGRLTTDLLRYSGGPFSIGSVVDLGPTVYAGGAPEIEDHYFDPAKATWLFDDDPEDYWELLNQMAYENLAALFGPDLDQRDRSRTVGIREGHASLGCLAPKQRPSLYVDQRGAVRIALETANLSVADLRLYERDHRTPRRDLVTSVRRRIQTGVEVILSVGLTRLWRKQEDASERHWLQVNNVHLQDDPLWK